MLITDKFYISADFHPRLQTYIVNGLLDISIGISIGITKRNTKFNMFNMTDFIKFLFLALIISLNQLLFSIFKK